MSYNQKMPIKLYNTMSQTLENIKTMEYGRIQYGQQLDWYKDLFQLLTFLMICVGGKIWRMATCIGIE